jgi:TP901 family phage tail tape measure protein
MNGYKLSIDEAKDALDAMALVAAESASDLNELATAETRVASLAHDLGVSQNQLTAQLSTMVSVTRQAPETVGNALRSIYARIADLKLGQTLEDGVNLGKVSGALDSIGVHVLDASGDMREMGDIIEDLMEK